MSDPKGVLVVMAKRPQLGRAKTRLAESVGNELALSFYQKMLLKTLQTASKVPFEVIVAATGEGNYEFPSRFHLQEQVPGDLGLRMASAFSQAFEKFSQLPAVMIGTDCYELTPAIIERSFELLQTKDVVLGPSEDGGYYLIGMKTVHPTLFSDMEWSVETVLVETQKRLKLANVTCAEVDTLNDIDTLDDLKKSALYHEVEQQLNELK